MPDVQNTAPPRREILVPSLIKIFPVAFSSRAPPPAPASPTFPRPPPEPPISGLRDAEPYSIPLAPEAPAPPSPPKMPRHQLFLQFALNLWKLLCPVHSLHCILPNSPDRHASARLESSRNRHCIHHFLRFPRLHEG